MANDTNMDRNRRIAAKLDLLIVTFPEEQYGLRDEILDCYLQVVGAADEELVNRLVDDFLEARVAGHSLAILPTAPQLAKHLRDLKYEADAEAFDFGKAAPPVSESLSTEKVEPAADPAPEGVAYESPDGARRLLSIVGGRSNTDEPNNAA